MEGLNQYFYVPKKTYDQAVLLKDYKVFNSDKNQDINEGKVNFTNEIE